MRRTKEGAEQTRQSILSSAFKVFLSDGFEGSSLEKICRQANVTRGAAYWHFKNKRDLYIQTIASVLEKMDMARFAIQQDEKLSLKEAIVEVLWRPREMQESFAFIGQAVSYHKENPDFTEIATEVERGEMRLYWYFLTELSKQEELAYPVEHLASILYTFFIGLYGHPSMSTVNVKNITKETIEHFVELVLVPSSIAVSM